MVAQPAVAVSTQRLEASLAEDVGDAREDRLMRALLERLSARLESSQAAAAAQAASAERVDPAQLQRLKEQLDALQRAIESIPVPPTQGR